VSSSIASRIGFGIPLLYFADGLSENTTHDSIAPECSKVQKTCGIDC